LYRRLNRSTAATSQSDVQKEEREIEGEREENTNIFSIVTRSFYCGEKENERQIGSGIKQLLNGVSESV